MNNQIETGLVLEGGPNIDTNLIELAASYGFDVPPEVFVILEALPIISIEDMDFIFDVADEAEDWLQENEAPEGYSYGWFDGNFYLLSNNQWKAMLGE